MPVVITDNEKEYFADLVKMTPARKIWTTSIGNDAKSDRGFDYPSHLQARAGFSVINAQHFLENVTLVLAAALEAEVFNNKAVKEALQASGSKEVVFYQSHTGQFKPEVFGQAGTGPRPVHPDGWADWKRLMASSFWTSINNAQPTRYPYNP